MNSSFDDIRWFSRERLLDVVRRWALLVVLGAAVAGVAAFFVSRVIPPQYRATAELFLAPASSPTVAFQDVILGQNLARSYVQLATADVVLRPAMASVGITDFDLFKSRARVSQLRDTSVITISYLDEDPSKAADAANAIAKTFIGQTNDLQSTIQGSATSQLEEQIASVQTDIKQLDSDIASLRTELAATPRPGVSSAVKADQQAALLQLDASRQSKQQTLAQLLKTRDDMRLAAARAENTVSLWQSATPPAEPEFPRPGLNALLGAAAGGLLTLIAIGVISYLDDRFVDIEDIRRRLGVAALGQVHLGSRPETTVGKLFVRDAPTSSEAESFRALRTNLSFASVDERPRVVLVTSARAGEGKSVVSANLALAFAEAGTQTILVDADLRRPSQHRLFRISPTTGLTTFLKDGLSAAMLRQLTVAPNLVVLPSGPLPPNPAELLASERMSALLRDLAKVVGDGIVIVDSSPVLAVADPVALATKTDGCVFVIDSTRTRTAASHHGIEALRRVRTRLLGAVLNKVSSADTYYYYGYYEEYGPKARPSQQSTPKIAPR